MADVSPAVLEAISKAKDSQAAAANADAEHEKAVEAVTAAQETETETSQASLEAHQVALDDAHTAIDLLKAELGLS